MTRSGLTVVYDFKIEVLSFSGEHDTIRVILDVLSYLPILVGLGLKSWRHWCLIDYSDWAHPYVGRAVLGLVREQRT